MNKNPTSQAIARRKAYEARLAESVREVVAEEMNRLLQARLRKVIVALWGTVIGGAGTGICTLFYMGYEWGSLDTRIEGFEKAFAEHRVDDNSHERNGVRFQQFVSRQEWSKSTEDATQAISEVHDQLKRIENRLYEIKSTN